MNRLPALSQHLYTLWDDEGWYALPHSWAEYLNTFIGA